MSSELGPAGEGGWHRRSGGSENLFEYYTITQGYFSSHGENSAPYNSALNSEATHSI